MTQAEANKIPKKEIEKITTKVTVYSTDKDSHHKTGESWVVNQKLAESMEERGLVTLTKP